MHQADAAIVDSGFGEARFDAAMGNVRFSSRTLHDMAHNQAGTQCTRTSWPSPWNSPARAGWSAWCPRRWPWTRRTQRRRP